MDANPIARRAGAPAEKIWSHRLGGEAFNYLIAIRVKLLVHEEVLWYYRKNYITIILETPAYRGNA